MNYSMRKMIIPTNKLEALMFNNRYNERHINEKCNGNYKCIYHMPGEYLASKFVYKDTADRFNMWLIATKMQYENKIYADIRVAYAYLDYSGWECKGKVLIRVEDATKLKVNKVMSYYRTKFLNERQHLK